MKKLLLSTLAIAMIAFASCGDEEETDPADVKTEDMETACDCVDAMEKIADRQIEILDGEESKKTEEEYENLEEKMNELGRHCSEEFERSEAEACDNYEAVFEKMKKVR